jgi:Zn-dependent protease
MVQCDKCGRDEYMPFRCKYCGGYYCSEHRLPEMHGCTGYYQYSRSTTGSTGFNPTGYSYGPQPQRGFFWFSPRELRDLAIGLLVIIAIPLTTWWGYLFQAPMIIVGALLIFALAFILHELAHKFMAQRLGYWAEFRLNQQGLIITLLSFISPFKVIAPGAVMIGGLMNWDHYGKVSVVGPATNIALGIIYYAASLLTGSQTVYLLANIGMNINASLALFNLIPFGVFDGAKIMKWNKLVWGAAVLSAGILFLVSTL